MASLGLTFSICFVSIPAQSLSQLFRDFSVHEENKIGADSIGNARDAFGETLKHVTSLAGEDLGRECFGHLFITHVHDEALLRVRSFTQALGNRFCRARYSKVLEHVVSLHTDKRSLKWLCEMLGSR